MPLYIFVCTSLYENGHKAKFLVLQSCRSHPPGCRSTGSRWGAQLLRLRFLVCSALIPDCGCPVYGLMRMSSLHKPGGLCSICRASSKTRLSPCTFSKSTALVVHSWTKSIRFNNHISLFPRPNPKEQYQSEANCKVVYSP